LPTYSFLGMKMPSMVVAGSSRAEKRRRIPRLVKGCVLAVS
jgi:hypothetical protein